MAKTSDDDDEDEGAERKSLDDKLPVSSRKASEYRIPS